MATSEANDHIFGRARWDVEDLNVYRFPTITIGLPTTFPETKEAVLIALFAQQIEVRPDYYRKNYGLGFDIRTLDESPEMHLVDRLSGISKAITECAIYNIERANTKHPPAWGLFAARACLIRLRTTFRAQIMLLRNGFHFEAAANLRMLLEQIAWAYKIRKTEDDSYWRISPANCISTLKEVDPSCGRTYGKLSELTHISADNTRLYVYWRTDIGSYQLKFTSDLDCVFLMPYLCGILMTYIQVCKLVSQWPNPETVKHSSSRETSDFDRLFDEVRDLCNKIFEFLEQKATEEQREIRNRNPNEHESVT